MNKEQQQYFDLTATKGLEAEKERRTKYYEQLQREKEKKTLMVLKTFLSCEIASLDEVVRETGIPKSSAQRYLTNPDLPHLLFNQGYENPTDVYNIVQEKLSQSKYSGQRKGGLTFAQNNFPIKDENGKFVGSKRK